MPVLGVGAGVGVVPMPVEPPAPLDVLPPVDPEVLPLDVLPLAPPAALPEPPAAFSSLRHFSFSGPAAIVAHFELMTELEELPVEPLVVELPVVPLAAGDCVPLAPVLPLVLPEDCANDVAERASSAAAVAVPITLRIIVLLLVEGLRLRSPKCKRRAG